MVSTSGSDHRGPLEVERGRDMQLTILPAGLARRNTDALRQARLDALLEQGRLTLGRSVRGRSEDELTHSRCVRPIAVSMSTSSRIQPARRPRLISSVGSLGHG